MKNKFEAFATHKATLVQNTDRFLIIDWRREDGSSNCYVNYILDKKRGNFVVSGDLGDAIATWYNAMTPENLKSYIRNNTEYFIKKIQCSSDLYVYDYDEVIADIKKHLDEDSVKEFVEQDFSMESVEDFWQMVRDGLELTGDDTFVLSDELEEALSSIYPDYWEWLYSCGRSVHQRVYMWVEGFCEACDQLGI